MTAERSNSNKKLSFYFQRFSSLFSSVRNDAGIRLYLQ